MSSDINNIMATEALISAVSRALALGSALQRSLHAAAVHREMEAVLVEIDRAAQEDPTSPLPMPLIVGLEQLLLGGRQEALFAFRVIMILLAYKGCSRHNLEDLRLCQVGARPFKQRIGCIGRAHTHVYSLHGRKRAATLRSSSRRHAALIPPAATCLWGRAPVTHATACNHLAPNPYIPLRSLAAVRASCRVW
jgi:hypothetical protein